MFGKKNEKIFTESDVYEQEAGYWKAQKIGVIGWLLGILIGFVYMVFGEKIQALGQKIVEKFKKNKEDVIDVEDKTTDD